MKKLNKDEQVKVEIAKEAINKLQEAQEIIYTYLIKDLGEDDEWLCDYIYNCNSTDKDEYTTMVMNKLFE